MIKLIVGLGNPGKQYAATRHNVGACLVKRLAKQTGQPLRDQSKLKGKLSQIAANQQRCFLFVPTTFMNLSGQAVRACASFYKIAVEEILIIHDDLDFAAGVVRLKQAGGDGCHNGLKDIIAHLQSRDFFRLRIGIGHPGNSEQVSNYVLQRPTADERQQINTAMDNALTVIDAILAGEIEQAMNILHQK